MFKYNATLVYTLGFLSDSQDTFASQQPKWLLKDTTTKLKEIDHYANSRKPNNTVVIVANDDGVM